MTTGLDSLHAIPYFAGLDRSAFRDLADAVRERVYRKDERVLLEDEPCRGLYIVVAGRVKVFKLSAGGQEQVLRILGPGRTFNDVPVFDGGPNPAGVSALQESRIALIPRERILALMDRHPRMAQAVIRVLAARLRAMTVLVEDLTFRSVVARVAKLLLDCAAGREILVEDRAGACARLTQQQIATMTGSVREVVQRALKTLEREGAIAMGRARIRILDPATLERWSAPTGAVPARTPTPPAPAMCDLGRRADGGGTVAYKQDEERGR
jgi:CRP-like cAMP-binding protein